jgi:hypothetical protein
MNWSLAGDEDDMLGLDEQAMNWSQAGDVGLHGVEGNELLCFCLLIKMFTSALYKVWSPTSRSSLTHPPG